MLKTQLDDILCIIVWNSCMCVCHFLSRILC